MIPELSDVEKAAAQDAGCAEHTPQAAVKGRPRSEAVSQSIIEAALDLIAEHGSIADVSVEAVAERSGVSKATIYRRWSSKEDLIAAAMESIKAPIPDGIPRTSLREDLIFIANNMRRTFGPRDMKVIKCMMMAVKDPEYQRHHDKFVERRRTFVRNTFKYWAEHGELREDVDLDLAVAMFVSPMLTIYIYRHYADLQGPNTVEQIVDGLIGGLGKG